MLREVGLSRNVAGRLFLRRMPGRYSMYAHACREILGNRIDRVVSLAPLEEIGIKSPDYAKAIATNRVQWKLELFPVPDFGVPNDREAFLQLAKSIGGYLSEGERLLIHCGAGVGRTGTLATCVLLALGESLEKARTTVQAAGSSPETPEQRELVSWAASQLSSTK
jgi:protein-tyrosine phosphatase